MTDPEVSEAIGYCKADSEDISFTLCDRGASESPCSEGEVCKIGTIDPQIGVCAEVTGSTGEGGAEGGAVAGVEGNAEGGAEGGHGAHEHDHEHEHEHEAGHDHDAEGDDHEAHAEGCHSGSGRASIGMLLAFALCLLTLMRRDGTRERV